MATRMLTRSIYTTGMCLSRAVSRKAIQPAAARSFGTFAQLSRKLGGKVAPLEGEHKGKYTVAIIGGGSAGVSVAAQLLRTLPKAQRDIAIIEPADTHYYQPGWTMVGGLGLPAEGTAQPMSSVIPPGVTWLQSKCTSFEPDLNVVMLSDGRSVHYDILVVAAGMQTDFGAVKGLHETLGKNGVSSIYSYDHAPAAWKDITNLQEGIAIFTNPSTPIKCGGAPMKIMFLAESYWRSQGDEAKIDVAYQSGGSACFGVKSYSDALERIMDERKISRALGEDLVEVDGPARKAVFRTFSGDLVEKRFDMMHVAPPMSAPDFIKHSPIASASGYVSVDASTGQHLEYPNIFSLGDCSSMPTSKTYSAISSQAPVVVRNIAAVLSRQAQGVAYDGYTACPILVGDSKLILAEFNGYTKEPSSFLAPFMDPRSPSSLFYLMKRYIFPLAYWNFTPIGRWFGKSTFFEPSLKLGQQLRLPTWQASPNVDQLFDNESSTYTYLLTCPETGSAVVIDPVLGHEDQILSIVRERNLNLEYSLETHVHADHVTAASKLQESVPNMKSVVSAASNAAAHLLVQNEDEIKFGTRSLKVLATPGHTSGCVTYVLQDGSDVQAAFTGDALLIGGCGRTDFQEGSAEKLYDSVHRQVFSLPAETKIYPGHDYKGRRVSSVRVEKQTNSRLTKPKSDFITVMANLNLPKPRLMEQAVPANLQGGVLA